jgi:hypothetical protein
MNQLTIFHPNSHLTNLAKEFVYFLCHKIQYIKECCPLEDT